MVKLIVSDIDGTLLPYGQTALSPTLFPVIRELKERGGNLLSRLWAAVSFAAQAVCASTGRADLFV